MYQLLSICFYSLIGLGPPRIMPLPGSKPKGVLPQRTLDVEGWVAPVW